MSWIEFQSRKLDIQNRIARLIAERDGLNWDHPGSRYSAESEASDLISTWARNPNREPSNEIEQLAADAVQVDHEMVEYRETLKAERAAALAKIEAELEPAPDPDIVELTFGVRDPDWPVTRPVRLRVPREWVTFL